MLKAPHVEQAVADLNLKPMGDEPRTLYAASFKAASVCKDRNRKSRHDVGSAATG